MSDLALRRVLIDTACTMNSCGINQGTSGNISVRCDQGFLITPSALPYEQCTPQDIVLMDMHGQATGRRKPSSEWRMHRDLYRTYAEAGCVLHAHSTWCTTLACLEKAIPPFHYMVAVAGGDSIPCAPYAPFGTQQLSDILVQTIQGRKACLLAHHGLVCFADEMEHLLPLAVEVEALAKMYVQALQIEPPPLLSNEQMADVLSRFAAYKA